MLEYRREYPLFSLCGLNCGLCPRYHTQGTSKCPGCGAADFHLKHPACAVITCNKKHDAVEFCFQCSQFPCAKYKSPSPDDSFITYRNVLEDLLHAGKDLRHYQQMLEQKIQILNELIANFNDGRKKNFFCLAVNLLSLDALKSVLENLEKSSSEKACDMKTKADLAVAFIKKMSVQEGHVIELRKK